MKKKLIPIITISFLIALLIFITSWFIDYNPLIKTTIYKVLFSLLGALYIINSFSSEKKEHKIILSLCGLCIIIMGFVGRTLYSNILSLIAIIIPIVIHRFTTKTAAK